MSLIITIFFILLFMAAAGWWYAKYVRYHPAEETWTEVVIGVGGTIAGEAMIIFLTLLYYNLLPVLWWLCFIPFICYAMTGISQIIQQRAKHREDERKANEKEKGFNGEN